MAANRTVDVKFAIHTFGKSLGNTNTSPAVSLGANPRQNIWKAIWSDIVLVDKCEKSAQFDGLSTCCASR